MGLRDIKRGAVYISASGLRVAVVGFYRHNKNHEAGVLYIDYLEITDSFDYVWAGDQLWWEQQGFILLANKPDSDHMLAKLERIWWPSQKKTPARGRGKSGRKG